MVLSLDSSTQEEEASIKKTAVGPTLILSMEGMTALTRESIIEVMKAGHPIMASANETLVVTLDGSSTVAGPSTQAE